MTVTEPEIRLHDPSLLDAMLKSAEEREALAAKERQSAAHLNSQAAEIAKHINNILAAIGKLTADDGDLDNALRALAEARNDRVTKQQERDGHINAAENHEKTAADFRNVVAITRRAAGLDVTDTIVDGPPGDQAVTS